YSVNFIDKLKSIKLSQSAFFCSSFSYTKFPKTLFKILKLKLLINGLNILINLIFFPCILAIFCTISLVFTYSLFCGRYTPLLKLSIIFFIKIDKLSIYIILRLFFILGKTGVFNAKYFNLL